MTGREIRAAGEALQAELGGTEARIQVWAGDTTSHVAVSIVIRGCRVRVECPIGHDQRLEDVLGVCAAKIRCGWGR